MRLEFLGFRLAPLRACVLMGLFCAGSGITSEASQDWPGLCELQAATPEQLRSFAEELTSDRAVVPNETLGKKLKTLEGALDIWVSMSDLPALAEAQKTALRALPALFLDAFSDSESTRSALVDAVVRGDFSRIDFFAKKEDRGRISQLLKRLMSAWAASEFKDLPLFGVPDAAQASLPSSSVLSAATLQDAPSNSANTADPSTRPAEELLPETKAAGGSAGKKRREDYVHQFLNPYLRSDHQGSGDGEFFDGGNWIVYRKALSLLDVAGHLNFRGSQAGRIIGAYINRHLYQGPVPDHAVTSIEGVSLRFAFHDALLNDAEMDSFKDLRDALNRRIGSFRDALVLDPTFDHHPFYRARELDGQKGRSLGLHGRLERNTQADAEFAFIEDFFAETNGGDSLRAPTYHGPLVGKGNYRRGMWVEWLKNHLHPGSLEYAKAIGFEMLVGTQKSSEPAPTQAETPVSQPAQDQPPEDHASPGAASNTTSSRDPKTFSSVTPSVAVAPVAPVTPVSSKSPVTATLTGLGSQDFYFNAIFQGLTRAEIDAEWTARYQGHVPTLDSIDERYRSSLGALLALPDKDFDGTRYSTRRVSLAPGDYKAGDPRFFVQESFRHKPGAPGSRTPESLTFSTLTYIVELKLKQNTGIERLQVGVALKRNTKGWTFTMELREELLGNNKTAGKINHLHLETHDESVFSDFMAVVEQGQGAVTATELGKFLGQKINRMNRDDFALHDERGYIVQYNHIRRQSGGTNLELLFAIFPYLRVYVPQTR